MKIKKNMINFQNIFSQNGAFIAISWEPASKSPLNSNHTQNTGILNIKAYQLQKLWEVSNADLFRGLLSCWSCCFCCCCYCCYQISAGTSNLVLRNLSERHRKNVKIDSKDLGVGWADNQKQTVVQRGVNADLAPT